MTQEEKAAAYDALSEIVTKQAEAWGLPAVKITDDFDRIPNENQKLCSELRKMMSAVVFALDKSTW